MRPVELFWLSRSFAGRRIPAVKAALLFPNGPVIVDRHMVINHRYLAAHKLPHSASVAAVHLPRRTPHAPPPVMPGLLQAA